MQKNNSKSAFLALSILSFIVSGYFTLLLFKSSSTGLFEAIPMVAVAIIYEFSKWCLLREVVTKNHTGIIKGIIFTLWLFTTSASIIASAGYVLNQANESKNVNIENSTAFQMQVENRKTMQDLYSQKKKELDNLIQTKENSISAMEKTRDSWPKNYITMKENAQYTINRKVSEFDNAINTKSQELTSISSQLQAPIKVEGEILSTSGYTALFSVITDFMNKNDKSAKKNPYRAENIEMWFYLLLGIGIEALANIFAYLAQKEKLFIEPGLKPKYSETCETTTFPMMQKNKFKLKPAGNTIGFKPEPKVQYGIDEKEFQAYIKYMYDKQKNGYAPGYLDIARNVNIAVEKARAIKGELQRRGIIKTEGNRTIILQK